MLTTLSLNCVSAALTVCSAVFPVPSDKRMSYRSGEDVSHLYSPASIGCNLLMVC